MARSFLLFLLVPLPILAQGAPAPQATPGPVSADVVVTAEASPLPQRSSGVAATVIDEGEIARSKESSVLELLRTVPGLDVAQSGGPGTVTSLFLRGTNSNQTLVLVDGVKLNSPYFGGVDLSTLSTANLERVEVVRGPFSALYGSEAVGGVVQLFTRRAAPAGFSLNGTLGAGNGATRDGSLALSFGTGPVELTAGFRRLLTDGELPNETFAATNLSSSATLALSPSVRAGLLVRHDESRTGIPFSNGTPTLHRSTTADTTSATVPVSLALGAATVLEAAASFAVDSPTYSDPDDPYGFTRSKTDARRTAARVTLSRQLGAQRLSVGGDWERTLVRNEDSYGVELDDVTTRTWSLFLEDRLNLLDDTLVLTAGVRRDEHSAFGGRTSPRAALSYRPLPPLKLRVAAGSAFRSPTTGELYYPFSGNPALKPERSTSFEGGAEVELGARLTLEASVFQNDVDDLIQYDFATGTNRNVGLARMRGVETVLRGTLSGGLFARASYTWLDAVDRETGAPLLRRPRHRASATLGAAFGGGASAELTGLFVGRRADRDAATFALVEDPSCFRLDVAATFPRVLPHLAPFVRVSNLLGRRYAEVAGFPSPGRRFLAGLDLGF